MTILKINVTVAYCCYSKPIVNREILSIDRLSRVTVVNKTHDDKNTTTKTFSITLRNYRRTQKNKANTTT